jgi:hypothetical protein
MWTLLDLELWLCTDNSALRIKSHDRVIDTVLWLSFMLSDSLDPMLSDTFMSLTLNFKVVLTFFS